MMEIFYAVYLLKSVRGSGFGEFSYTVLGERMAAFDSEKEAMAYIEESAYPGRHYYTILKEYFVEKESTWSRQR